MDEDVTKKERSPRALVSSFLNSMGLFPVFLRAVSPPFSCAFAYRGRPRRRRPRAAAAAAASGHVPVDVYRVVAHFSRSKISAENTVGTRTTRRVQP